ncbi:hypothetical protein ASE00_15465 [Sphingomonas sp. Root710]|uniref:DMT family transporter n=1 Tax=Sphingomonas sp. Root710 TaxID=1736594 RepID=UPI0006F3DACE|nr:DMT family transporter [Sphingomonas sp. Root710]KRB81376.1 hypothetical protein ASE00_15465 [Sphingomonas sp. Root710]
MSPSKPHDQHHHHLRGIILRSLAVLGFAAMIASLKKASEGGAGVIEMVFYRSLFGMPVVLVWLMIGPGLGMIRTQRPRAHLIRSAIGITGVLLNFGALSRLSLPDAVTIGFSAPIFATILSALLLNDKVGRHRWTAVAIGFLGVAMIVRPGGQPIDHLGVIIAIGGAIGTAGVTVTVRQLGGTEHVGAIVFWFFVCSMTVSGVGMIFLGHTHPPETWLMLILGGMFGAVAQVLMTMSLQAAPVSVVAPFDYAQIVWASILGWLVWSVVPGLNMLAGATLIVGSGLYTAWREHRLNRNLMPATPPIE